MLLPWLYGVPTDGEELCYRRMVVLLSTVRSHATTGVDSDCDQNSPEMDCDKVPHGGEVGERLRVDRGGMVDYCWGSGWIFLFYSLYTRVV
jgi:hypothetical protein